jgi:RNA polymerase sigma-70 factor, ECF subfamily
LTRRVIDGESEATLVRARGGDRRALASVLRHHRGAIERMCTRICAASDGQADDVLQDTYLGIVTNIAGFRGEASFLTWAYTIARTAHGRQRRYERKALRLEALASEASAIASWAANERPPDEKVALRELGAVLAEALATLPRTDRQVLLMRDLEGWNAKEVAARTGLTVPAVKTRLHRARVAMRSQLAVSPAAA